MSYTLWIEIIAALTMLLVSAGIMCNRCLRDKNGGVKGIGVRVIQLMALSAILPVTLILALEKVLDGGSVATIIGTLVGYLFAHISNFDKQSD
jgi:hypothetical protein